MPSPIYRKTSNYCLKSEFAIQMHYVNTVNRWFPDPNSFCFDLADATRRLDACNECFRRRLTPQLVPLQSVMRLTLRH